MTPTLKRRLLIPILCLMLIFALSLTAGADDSDPDGALQAILQGYADGAESIDLTQYNITPEQLYELYYTPENRAQFPWYADSYKTTHYTQSGLIASFIYTNLDPAIYDYALYEQKVAEILNETVLPGMSEWQIALSIHDYLASNFAYDETYTYYEGYDLLVRGTAVCNGYSEAYMDLLQRAGLACIKVDSYEMDHSWNLVYCNGNWLHVDVTWDDPTSNRQGQVLHQYFMLSDEAISDADHNHYGWNSSITCTYTEWDTDRFWHGIDSQICWESTDVCYLRYQTGETAYTLYSRDSQSGEWSKIITSDAGYIDIGGSKDYDYFYHNNGLSLFNGKLYYSDMTKVYSINPDGSGKKTVYSHNYSSNKSYIAGSFVTDGILYITLSTHDGDLTSMQIDLNIETHTHSYSCQTVAPGCTSAGYNYYSCECGVSYEADRVHATGHSYDGGTLIREATAYTIGIMRYTCEHCGFSYDEDIVYTPEIPQPATSNSNGSTTGSGSSSWQPDPDILPLLLVVLIIIFAFRKKKK